MATVGEAIAASISAQWNVGTGGVKPDPIVYIVAHPEINPNPKAKDAVFVWLPLRRVFDNEIDVADKYRNVTYTIRIECHTKTDSARQLEIENEVDRIIASGTVIVGATTQKTMEINDVSNRSYSVGAKFVSEILIEVFTAMEASATAYGGATTAALVTDTLEFTAGGGTIDIFYDEDDMASDDEDGLASQQSIKAYVDDQPNTSSISNAGAIALKPSGDTDDYVSLTTVSGLPRHTIVGGWRLVLESDDATKVALIISKSTSSMQIINDLGNTRQLFECTGELFFRVNGDNDDYWAFSTVANVASLLPNEDKVHNIGAPTFSADHMYSDDFDNTSPFEEFLDPLADLKKIKPNTEKDGLDYTSLPDFVRTHTRDPTKHIMDTKTVDGKEVSYVVERAPKDVIEPEGWSVNRMVMFLYQVCQKQQEEIEALKK